MEWLFLAAGLLLIAGTAAILITGVSGSMAALTNMLFPSATIAEGIQLLEEVILGQLLPDE